jgi:hypothetical protein
MDSGYSLTLREALVLSLLGRIWKARVPNLLSMALLLIFNLFGLALIFGGSLLSFYMSDESLKLIFLSYGWRSFYKLFCCISTKPRIYYPFLSSLSLPSLCASSYISPPA